MNFLRKTFSFATTKHDPHEPDQINEKNETVDDTEPESQGNTSVLKSIFGKLKIGTDVFRAGLSLPASLYEPLSILQRQAEMVEFGDILTSGAQFNDPLEILAHVGAFTVSSYSATERCKINYNPLLGETFEYIDKKTNTWLISEQVSHHPPISALHAENDDWIFWQNCSPSTQFLGNSIDLNTNGHSYIYFPKTKDHFFYTNTVTRVHNLIIGSMWLEHYGSVSIKSLQNGQTCIINFKKSGVFQGVQHYVEGYVCDDNGTQCIKLEGKWNSYVDATWLVDTTSFTKGTVKRLWQVPECYFLGPPYNLSRFAAMLNDIDEEMDSILPSTDSRRRLDRLYLELGDNEKATEWKFTLEDKQRQDKKKKEEWKPVWFKQMEEKTGDVKHEDKKIWVYSGEYWEHREKIKNALKQGNDISELKTTGITGSACDFLSYDDPNEVNRRKLQKYVLEETKNLVEKHKSNQKSHEHEKSEESNHGDEKDGYYVSQSE